MKKLIVLIVSLFILNMFVTPVFAAEAAQVTVSVSRDTVRPGETVTVTVSITAVKDCINGGFMFSYDKDVFEYIDGKALVKGFAMAGVTDMAGSLSGYFMNVSGSEDILGALFQVTFKVKDSATSGTYTFSGTPSISTMNGDVKETITCSAGSASVTVAGCAHSWDSGKITKEATCKEAGTKVLTCTQCSATKSETIEPLTTHTYDHDCDGDCNVCGAARAITHQYLSAWSKDEDAHWMECSVCKDRKDVSAHTPGEAATEDTPQACTTCGYILTPALNHKHDYTTLWITNEDAHWHTCSGCEEKDSYAAHSFGNGSDTVCSICGYAAKPVSNSADSVTEPAEILTIGADTSGNRQLTILLLSVAIAAGVATVGILTVLLTKKEKRAKRSRK